jgi:hypothetical protein
MTKEENAIISLIIKVLEKVIKKLKELIEG